jgi:uncharacterized protein (DUF1684 family)
MRRRGLHGAKVAYRVAQEEAAERARHRELVFLDLELTAVHDLQHAVLDDSEAPVRAKRLAFDGLGVEFQRLQEAWRDVANRRRS